MKSLCLIIAAVGALLSSHVAHSMTNEMAACMEKTGITTDDVVTWRDTGMASDALKCNFKCLMMSHGTMTEDGKLLCEPMLEKFPPEHHAVVRECCDIEQGGELCDLAYRHNKCLRDKMPEFYMNMMSKKIAP